MAVPIGRLLTDLAATGPDRPAITCGGRTVTRSALEARANRLARSYETLGVKQGDMVTIALQNSIEFYEAAFAVWKLGAVPQPVSSRLPVRERAAIIELAGSSLVVGVTDASSEGRCTIPQGFEPDPSLSDAPIDPVRIPPAWKAPTSGGSTGRPKLIVSGGTGEIEPEIGKRLGMCDDGVQLVPGPLYHNAPLTFSILGLCLGNHLVVLPKFDAAASLIAIQTHRVDWVCLVPTMMLRIWRITKECPGTYDLSSLRQVWHTAAPCPSWLKEAWINLVGADTVMEMYAGTEAQAYTIIAGSEWLQHRGSVGKAAFGEMRVLAADGSEAPRGAIGEIFMRSPEGSGPSYHYVGAEPRVQDGWESLGDVGSMDEDGYLYLSDRRTDLILSGGANIYPAEVEAALMEHPLVDTCAVVGLPDEELGQRVHAVVYVTTPVEEQDLLAFLRERLVLYKVPRSVRFVEEPVRDDAGKVRRTALRDQETAQLTPLAPGESGSTSSERA